VKPILSIYSIYDESKKNPGIGSIRFCSTDFDPLYVGKVVYVLDGVSPAYATLPLPRTPFL
jgi:hypothetical protein